MESVTKLMSVLAISMVVVAVMGHEAAAQVQVDVQVPGANNINNKSDNNDLIKTVCEKSPTKDLCLEILSGNTSSVHGTPTMKDLAITSLRVAASNASNILAEVKKMIDRDDLTPDIQQGLADCKETILDAEYQLEDTIASLLEDADQDAQKWLQAALAAIDTCDASIPGDDDILSVESTAFRKLCNIAVEICKSLP